MKIIRDGKEILLSDDEIFRAYMVQKNRFDVETIENNASDYLPEGLLDVFLKDKKQIDDAAYKMRKFIDKYDIDFECALGMVFKRVEGEIHAEKLERQDIQ